MYHTYPREPNDWSIEDWGAYDGEAVYLAFKTVNLNNQVRPERIRQIAVALADERGYGGKSLTYYLQGFMENW